jgi:CheY-like chemotaxis protein
MAKKILIVEDNPDTVAMIHLLLENAGYAVAIAYDGQEGLEQARALNPDLILADIMMPRMDGLVMNQRLKEDPKTKDIPIVMISAHDGMRALFDNTLGTRVEDYLVKPVNSKILLAKLKALLP